MSLWGDIFFSCAVDGTQGSVSIFPLPSLDMDFIERLWSWVPQEMIPGVCLPKVPCPLEEHGWALGLLRLTECV